MKISLFTIITIATCAFIVMSLKIQNSEKVVMSSNSQRRRAHQDKSAKDTKKEKEPEKKEAQKKEPEKKENATEKKVEQKENTNSTNNSTNNSTSSSNSSLNESGLYSPGINVYGMPTKSAIIKSPPFTVTFCDQVIQYEGQTFINNSDYSNRKDIKFTMSTTFINLLSKNNGTDLLEAISLSSIVQYPSIIQGTKSCIQFLNDKTKQEIIICLKDKVTAENLLSAYEKFIQCRAGVNLKKNKSIDYFKVTKNDIIKKNGEKINPKVVQNIYKEELKKHGLIPKEMGINGKTISQKMIDEDEDGSLLKMVVPGSFK